MSSQMAMKCAGSGLTLQHLKDIYETRKDEGLVALLTENFFGKPRVTNNKAVIKRILEYFEKYIVVE